MTYRVWWYDEFKHFANEAERDDRAWPVPDTQSIMYPERPGVPCDDVEDAAEQYADYYHSNRDGWEDSWPVEFVVHDGANYHLVAVERETVPEFHAARPQPLVVVLWKP